MQRLNQKQIFLDTVRMYFAPLVGAIRGARREMARVERAIARRKAREKTSAATMCVDPTRNS